MAINLVSLSQQAARKVLTSPSLALDGMAMASPDHDVSRGGGDVGPHRHLEDQTDHLLFFCHRSSRGAKHYSHASWSLRSPCGIC